MLEWRAARRRPTPTTRWGRMSARQRSSEFQVGGEPRRLHCSALATGAWEDRTIVVVRNKGPQNLAIQHVKNGAGRMDIWYHLADEAGLEKEKPTLETSAADGIIAVVAASDTTASTLSSLVWFLLSHPEYYRRVQQELDSVIVDGDDPFDANKHQELHFLSACMSKRNDASSPAASNQWHEASSARPTWRHIADEATSIYSPAYALHRNPAYFSHPGPFFKARGLPIY
ncbi:cytochrome P450 [Mycena olivaceomarginata]|nr:cytochrome P450 [Mycena olivaceomarginata]